MPIMVAPSLGAVTVKAPSGNSYTTNAEGTVDVLASDVLALQTFGFSPLQAGPSNLTPGQSSNIISAGCPVAVPGSGSIGINGAVTLTTALPVIYPNIYLYFPVGALFAASVAGFYFCQMTSTTAGTAYNNVLTAGSPVALSPIGTPIVSAAIGAYTQTASAITTWSIQIPTGAMGTYGELEVEAYWRCSGTAGVKTGAILWGATAGAGTAIETLAESTSTVFGWSSRTKLCNQGLAVQVAMASGILADGALNTASTDFARYSVNTAAASYLTPQFTVATVATDYLILERHSVKVYPA